MASPMSGNSLAAVLSPGTFRLLLALVVVIDHFTGIMIGRAAVFLFFVLSGFWVHRMWIERYQLARLPYLTFVLSRMWRLMPVMLTVTVLAILVQTGPLGRPLESLWSDGLFHTIASHLFLIGYSSLGESRLLLPAWSLDVEMQFYLIAPILAAALAHFRMVVFAVVCGLLVIFDPTPAAFHALGWFAIGIMASAYGRQPPRSTVLVGFVAVLGVLAYAVKFDPSLLIDPLLNDQNRRLNIIIAIAGVPIALYTCFCSEDQSGRDRGNLSYVIYLVHWPLLLCAQWAQQWHFLAPAIPTIAILPVSLAIMRWVDSPLQRARACWVAGRIEATSETSTNNRSPNQRNASQAG